jgi:hypothetical protein
MDSKIKSKGNSIGRRTIEGLNKLPDKFDVNSLVSNGFKYNETKFMLLSIIIEIENKIYFCEDNGYCIYDSAKNGYENLLINCDGICSILWHVIQCMLIDRVDACYIKSVSNELYYKYTTDLKKLYEETFREELTNNKFGSFNVGNSCCEYRQDYFINNYNIVDIYMWYNPRIDFIRRWVRHIDAIKGLNECHGIHDT